MIGVKLAGITVAPVGKDAARKVLSGVTDDIRVITQAGMRLASCGICGRLILEVDGHVVYRSDGKAIARLCGPCVRADKMPPDMAAHPRASCPGCDAERAEPGLWEGAYGHREARE